MVGDSPLAEAVKVVARTHQSLIWDRQRHVLPMRSALRAYFPAFLQAFGELAASEALELLAKAPDPERVARLLRAQIAAAVTRANRKDVVARATHIQQTPRHGSCASQRR